MAKVFISQPMEGKSPDEIALKRSRAIESATHWVKFLYGDAEPVEIVDNLIDQPPEHNKMWLMAQCLLLLSTADVAYFCDTWRYADGCNMEHKAAMLYKTPYVIDDNLMHDSDKDGAKDVNIVKNF